MKVGIIGSSGREHAICQTLKKSANTREEAPTATANRPCEEVFTFRILFERDNVLFSNSFFNFSIQNGKT